MALQQVSATLTRDQAYRLVDAVMERDDLAVTASAHEGPDERAWIFEAGVDGEPDLDGFAALARDSLGEDISFSVAALDPSINWVEKSLEGLQPVSAGGFYVYGSHEAAPPPAGLIPIRIDAAQAFGTGHHETTTGCLEAINLTLRQRRPERMIDIGTGTGVLAIALAKRTHLPVLATDIDPVATETTIANAEDNGVGREITAITAAGLDHPFISLAGPYDLIVANILAGPLVSLAPGVARLAAPGATIILSGILLTQAPRVAQAYANAGLPLRRRLNRGAWATLILERP